MNCNASQTSRLLHCNSSAFHFCMPAHPLYHGTILLSAAYVAAKQWPTGAYKLKALRCSASQSSQSPARQQHQPVDEDSHSGQQLALDASHQQHAAPDVSQGDIGVKGRDRNNLPGCPKDTTLKPCLQLIQQGQVSAALDLLQELSSQYGPPERDVGDAILMVRCCCLLPAPIVNT